MNRSAFLKATKAWRTAARAAGWTIELSGSHERWKSPDGPMVTVSCTPGDHRALLNTRGDLRRAGLQV